MAAYLTWTSTIYFVVCVVAPFCNDHCYGNVRAHTLLNEKEHDSEHRRSVCCRGNKTGHRRYQREVTRRYAPGYGRSVLRVIRCTSCRAIFSRSLSSYCTPPTRDAGSYPWTERTLLLDSVTTGVPIGNSRSASSRGGIVGVFARSLM